MRVNMTFAPRVLRLIDRAAEEEGMTRSGFLAAAAKAYVRQSGQRVKSFRHIPKTMSVSFPFGKGTLIYCHYLVRNELNQPVVLELIE